jgi:pentose-5-phosphate-3-epimerase
MKLIPADTGITNVKLAVDKALNMTSAETNMITNATITCTFSKKLNQSLNDPNDLPFSFHLIIAAPDTFSNAYKKQKSTAFIMIS